MTVTTRERARRVIAAEPSSEANRLASFGDIIAHFAAQAKDAGMDPGRVDRAVALVLHPDVHESCWHWSPLDGYRTLILRSQSEPDIWYHVNGECQCMDYQLHRGWCKHRIARALIMRAEEWLEGGR